ncbi:hypothetical protein [Trinickia sp. NRRL B-1857]|uniref:hypothetical protein n=1 Tax=Trinickia sp. NRRL B-1857 TaxID=3162879 RepID=UPI003D2DEF9A
MRRLLETLVDEGCVRRSTSGDSFRLALGLRCLACDDAYIRNLVRQTREDGFGSNHGDWSEQKKIGALAVAVGSNDRVLASLNVIYLSKAIAAKEAVKRFLPELKQAAEEFTQALAGPDARTALRARAHSRVSNPRG